MDPMLISLNYKKGGTFPTNRMNCNLEEQRG